MLTVLFERFRSLPQAAHLDPELPPRAGPMGGPGGPPPGMGGMGPGGQKGAAALLAT